jgi:hypothetical protein
MNGREGATFNSPSENETTGCANLFLTFLSIGSEKGWVEAAALDACRRAAHNVGFCPYLVFNESALQTGQN